MDMNLPLNFDGDDSLNFDADCTGKRYLDPITGLIYTSILNVNNTPFSGNKVISLFSGAGGMDIGLEAAGFETVACVEHDKDCCTTLEFNRPEWNIEIGDDSASPGDIRYVKGEDILRKAGLRKGEAALVVGGPPCQPFSNIGKKQGTDDPVNGDLYAEFVRVVKECLPRGFIFENVAGLKQDKHRPLLNFLVQELSDAGYSIDCSILNAADYGVPQQRKRFIMLGLLGEEKPSFPIPTHHQDAASQSSLYRRIGFAGRTNFRSWATVGETFSSALSKLESRSDYALMNISEVVQNRMKHLKQGENFKALPMELRPNCWKNGRHQGQDTFGRMREDRPSLTIRTAAYNPAKGMYIHPTENRGLSSHEMAALQSFPMDWIFRRAGTDKVTLVSVGKQIGNAVPPPLAKALGLAMKISLMD